MHLNCFQYSFSLLIANRVIVPSDLLLTSSPPSRTTTSQECHWYLNLAPHKENPWRASSRNEVCIYVSFADCQELMGLTCQPLVGQLRDNGSQQPHLPASQMLSNFVFEQTEYVHTFLARTRKLGKTETKEQLPPVVEKCLLSYDAIMVFLKREIETSPSIIFAQ